MLTCNLAANSTSLPWTTLAPLGPQDAWAKTAWLDVQAGRKMGTAGTAVAWVEVVGLILLAKYFPANLEHLILVTLGSVVCRTSYSYGGHRPTCKGWHHIVIICRLLWKQGNCESPMICHILLYIYISSFSPFNLQFWATQIHLDLGKSTRNGQKADRFPPLWTGSHSAATPTRPPRRRRRRPMPRCSVASWCGDAGLLEAPSCWWFCTTWSHLCWASWEDLDASSSSSFSSFSSSSSWKQIRGDTLLQTWKDKK